MTSRKRVYLVYVVPLWSPTSDPRDARGTTAEFRAMRPATDYMRWLMKNNPDDRVVLSTEVEG